MNQTYCFAGASSEMAIKTSQLLKAKQNFVIGISTKENNEAYDEFYQVPNYHFGQYPKIEKALNGLVYFPGTINLKPFNRLTEKDFQNDLEINTLGAVAFIQSYLSNLKNTNNASIVLISTVAVQTGMPFHSSVALAKGALEGLTRALAAELAPGIRVNCIAPSLVNTPLGDKFINTPEKLEASQKRNPLKKVGEAKDIANTIEFLLSDNSAWITGQIFGVDGGMGALKIL